MTAFDKGAGHPRPAGKAELQLPVANFGTIGYTSAAISGKAIGTVTPSMGVNLSYSYQGPEFCDHTAELRKHSQIPQGSRTFWVRAAAGVSAGQV
jgi:hypothetical protein